MKKAIFLFFFFFASLLLALPNAQAQASPVGCSGTPGICGTGVRTTALGCVGSNVTATTTANGCTWTGPSGPCSTPTAFACTNVTSPSVCNAIGCVWTSSADANSNAFVTTLCNALKIVTGNGGKAFAAFAIISCGIGFFTGKISWGLMIGITAGIAAMFGAPTIVAAIAGGNALDCAA
jgi:type IV secretory pathway VirB2 component (pilin)